MDWGLNSFGELGNGTESNTPPCYCGGPVAVSGLTSVKSIGAGAYQHAAALLDGTVRVWGSNIYGQLGSSSAAGPESCDVNPCAKIPAAVAGLGGVQTIGSGLYAASALLGDGSARAWGVNEFGAFGNGADSGSEAAVPQPNLVSGASALTQAETGGFALIGPSQTLTVALTGDGTGSAFSREVNCPRALRRALPAGPDRHPPGPPERGRLCWLHRRLLGHRQLPAEDGLRSQRDRDLRQADGHQDHQGEGSGQAEASNLLLRRARSDHRIRMPPGQAQAQDEEARQEEEAAFRKVCRPQVL